MWLIISFLSPHNLHLLFCWGLSILALIWLVLSTLFCAAIRRDSVSFLNFPFLSHVQIFPLVIHASLSWREVNFLYQKLCIPSWSSVFQFDIFSVVLSKSMGISAFGSSSSPSSSPVILVYPFCLFVVFLVVIFLSKIVRFLLHLVVGIFSCHLLLVVDRIFFHCFGMSCFVCIVLPFVDISFIFLLSPVISDLFPQVVLLFFSFAFSFLFLHIPVSFLCFITLACFRRFFISVSSRNFHPGFDFSFVLFEGIPIFSQTNFAPA